MSSSESYTTILRIRVDHDYYDEQPVPVELQPKDPYVFTKYNLQLKRTNNTWNLFGTAAKRDDLRSDSEVLVFLIKPTNPAYHFVSQALDVDCPDYEVLEDALVKKIQISTKKELVNIRISAVAKYYEYILFPKKLEEEQLIEIIDAAKLVEFEAPQFTFWENGEKVIRCISKEKINLSRKNKSQFSLVERSTYGERILLNNMIIPKPNSASLYDPHQAITAFYTV